MSRKVKTASQKPKLQINVASKICSIAAIVFFTLFILLVYTDYTNITAVKYNLFLSLTGLLSVAYIFEKGVCVLDGEVSLKTSNTNYLPYAFAGGFLIFNCISALVSPHKDLINAKGQSVLVFGDARYDGLLVTALYVGLFLIFSFEKSIGKYFTRIVTVTLGITALTGILQLFGVNVLQFYPNGNFYMYPKFISTLGNIDMISALYCILLPLTVFSYVTENFKLAFKIPQLIVCFFAIFLLFKINVDSGRLAFIVTLIIAFNILFLKKEWFLRFINAFAVSVLGIVLSNITVFEFKEKLKIGFVFNKSTYVWIIILLFVLTLAVFYKFVLPQNKIKIGFICLVGFEVLVFAGALIWILNFAKPEHGTVYEFAEILKGRGKNGYGSARFGLWKYTLELSNQRFLIGHGSGTFRRTLVEFATGISKRYSRGNFDFAHNDFLQIYYNNGILGLVSYLGLIGTLAGLSFKKCFNNGKVLMLSMAFICYLVQSFFMFSIIIVSPLFWIVGGMLCYEIREGVDL